jgi:hypothetical protein
MFNEDAEALPDVTLTRKVGANGEENDNRDVEGYYRFRLGDVLDER